MSNSNLPAQQQVDAAIRVICDQYQKGRTFPRAAEWQVINRHPTEAIDTIAKKWEQDREHPAVYLLMLDRCYGELGGLLPLVIEASHSEDEAVRRLTVKLLVRTYRAATTPEADAVSISESSEQGDKYLQYAKRIIGRYDSDHSESLSEVEWSKMLVSPAPADANQDGLVTVQEYAVYLLHKTR